jgi:hypothetical protein
MRFINVSIRIGDEKSDALVLANVYRITEKDSKIKVFNKIRNLLREIRLIRKIWKQTKELE